MNNINIRNISFMIIFLVLLSMVGIYITYTKHHDLPVYTSLFHQEEE